MITNRLISLGFTPGVEIQVLQNNGHGPLVVNVRDTRVALGRGEAHDIFVERRNK
jgi:Fe2+ transport system protein FeoA